MSEVRALLLTDLVDSTRLAEARGDAAIAELWARHDRVARDLLLAHGGREIDKSDGFLLLFEHAREALDFAVAYHRALRELELTARAGLHVGPVVLRRNAPEDVARGAKPLEVEGLSKAVAARAMTLARGGQTLATAEAVDALDEAVVRLRPEPDSRPRGPSRGPVALSHGHWQLKGVDEPVELFEIGLAEEAPLLPPPDAPKAWRVVYGPGGWRPIREVRHSLPAERDAFVGRLADLRELARRLDEGVRLLTVVGIGGTGKTRLATRYGWTWLGAWPGGVWFCDLAEARTVEGIAYAVARALDVPLGKEDPVQQLGHALAARGRCLVVLDNFEQVARLARATLGSWLDRADRAQFLVTSRELLGLPGERALTLSPLGAAEAGALFVARADAARGGFEPTAEERATIDALVTLLDGLPLAIELAAARVRMMPVRQIRERMSDRFRLLASSGGRKDRQATLRAAIDWSWELLEPWEQAALAQCGVFEGGFTLEAVEAVLDLGAWPEAPWPMDVVQSLVDKSLVRPVGEARFGMLVSIQEYAREKLRAMGAERAAAARHFTWFASYGEDAALDALAAHGGEAKRRALAEDLDNLVTAGRRAVESGEAERAAALLRAAWEVLELHGPYQVGAALADAVLAATAQGSTARAWVEYVAGRAATLGGQPVQAAAHLGEARDRFSAVGDAGAESRVQLALSRLWRDQGRFDDAAVCFERGLERARSAGRRAVEGQLLRGLAGVRWYQGRLDEGLVAAESALAIATEVGDRRNQADALGELGVIRALQGWPDAAREVWSEGRAAFQDIGDRRGDAILRGNLGELELLQGRPDAALTHVEAALEAIREVGYRPNEGWLLGLLGEAHRQAGQIDQAREALVQGERLLRELQNLYQLGSLLGRRAELELEAGEREAARTALAEAEALLAEIGAGPEAQPARVVAGLRARLESEA